MPMEPGDDETWALDWPTRDDDGHGTAAVRPKADRIEGRLDGLEGGGVVASASWGRSRTPKPTPIAELYFLSACSAEARDGSGNRAFVDSLAPMRGLGAEESTLARFGPTTPTRARRLADASVDPTDARNATVRRFG